MLALLILVIGILAGVFVIFSADVDGLDHISAAPIALAVACALSLLYMLAMRRESSEVSRGRVVRLALAALVLTALGAVAYKYDLTSGLKSILPSASNDEAGGVAFGSAQSSVRLRRNDDGKYVAKGTVNGAAMDMLIDSGAATVLLRSSDAERAGINLSELVFDTPLQTANGTNYLAATRLRAVAIGPLRVEDVEALVAKPGNLNENLLGMSFLRRLSSYEVSGEFATLRQ